jgi:PhzF family phenazine biosynthesis protein
MRIFQVDAFTRTRFTGNPATVVLDADGQGDAILASVAREFPHAEAAFVLASDAPDHDLRLRFFNARRESAFVGHAIIAAHAVLLALGRRAAGVCRQKSGTGVIEVAAQEKKTGNPRQTTIEFRQRVPELDNPMPFKTTLRVAEALRLPGAQLHEVLPARIARMGSTRLLVPVAGARSLDDLAPNFETLAAIGTELGVDGFFAFAYRREGTELSTESRMFCPALGIPEDPVSGNAHAMLATYLWELGQLGKSSTSFIGRQGRHMKRPGEVLVHLDVDEEHALNAVRIGGGAVIVSEGQLAA